MSSSIFKTQSLRFAGSSDMWTETNMVLEAGAVGAELDTGKVKFGDGVSGWTALPYVGASATPTQTFATVATTGSYHDLINLPTTFVPPIASASTLGGVIPKNGLTVDAAGNLSANVVSVAGKTGAVSLVVTDVVGAASTAYVDSSVAAVPRFTSQNAMQAGTWTDAQALQDFNSLIGQLKAAGILH